ncbi:MAG: glutamine synthetase III [Desulfovibrionaceae bacterium]|nr:glutamine synthetase III [Desulfovibrionaceae bacterium]
MSSARENALRTIISSGIEPRPAEVFNADKNFGCDVFGLDVMRKRLPKAVFRKLEQIIRNGEQLDPSIADTVANAMKDWAIELGATHYTHWFQPMTGLTAEKHDAFIEFAGPGKVISEFSGKKLISGEPDASSFPSGGIRSTFEARGYTAWDPSVPAFVFRGERGGTLHIPCFFYSYSGEALDRKIPLGRSIHALSTQALRILRLFGNTSASRVYPVVGAEQEYFLVDRRLAMLRPDLMLTGRTLTGASSPKGQELEDHYFGAIPARVQDFMQDVEQRLEALGIPAKTRHNEVAPGQFELAPIFEESNIATDHNMLIMNVLKHVAASHGFVCFLHEKPFAGVNGSGKHNNWSLCDSDGNNLLNPGSTPQDNAQFLVFLAAILKAVHNHADMLRLGTIGAGNDHRLEANEAPPAIVSVFLGEQLEDVLNTIIGSEQALHGKRTPIEIGVSTLPPLPIDQSDRNRTSPFAFTGNKFEFRAVGSSQSIAPVNTVLNAAVANALEEIATELEAGVSAGSSLNDTLSELLPALFKKHMAVVFNGNGYSSEWPEEAARRGLPNYANTVEALEHSMDPSISDVFLRQHILTERELLSRHDIMLENYVKTVQLEARVLEDMARGSILPVTFQEEARTADLALKVKELCSESDSVEYGHFRLIREHNLALKAALDSLNSEISATAAIDDATIQARSVLNRLLPAMQAVRSECDALERIVERKQWPFPTYAEMMWTY